MLKVYITSRNNFVVSFSDCLQQGYRQFTMTTRESNHHPIKRKQQRKAGSDFYTENQAITKEQNSQIESLFMVSKSCHKPLKTHTCLVCMKIFLSNADLIRHERIHTGAKPFVCEVCGKAFRHNWQKKNHMRKSCTKM